MIRNPGDPKVDAMTEAELARYFEENKDNDAIWEKKPRKIRVRRGSASTTFSLRLAPEELTELWQAAQAEGKDLGPYMREAALERARGGAKVKH